MSQSYVSPQGQVLVIRYPVPTRSAGSGPLPPITIVDSAAIDLIQNASDAHISHVVYEPYET